MEGRGRDALGETLQFAEDDVIGIGVREELQQLRFDPCRFFLAAQLTGEACPRGFDPFPPGEISAFRSLNSVRRSPSPSLRAVVRAATERPGFDLGRL